MKYDYNPLSNRTKSDPVSENAINNIMHNDKIKEKKEERSFMNKFMKKLAYFLDKQGYFLLNTVSYTHLTLPTTRHQCRSRWSPYH